MDSEGIFVPFQSSSIPPDDFPFLSDGDDSEEEDTSPPPAVAGCKRHLTEDISTSEDTNLARPPKRYRYLVSTRWSCFRLKMLECHRMRADIEGALSKWDRAPPALSNPDPLLECIGTRDTEPTSVDMSPTHTSSDSPLHPTPSSRSYITSTSICHKRGRAELDGDSSNNFVSCDGISLRPTQRRKIIKSASPVLSKGVYSPPAVLGNYPSLGPSPPPGDPSRPSPYSVMEPVSASADVSSNTGIVDCNSIPSPPKGAAWICMLSLFSYPKYDLTFFFSHASVYRHTKFRFPRVESPTAPCS